MSNLQTRLRELRKRNNLTQSDMAKLLREKYKLKTDRVMISKWETGFQTPEIYTISRIAELFNVSIDFLNGSTEKESPADVTTYNPVVHKIPVLGYISAGLPLYADEHIEDYTYTERNGGAEYFALRVKGDSMNAAQINDGNMVIVRVQPVIENGEIAVVRVNGDNATVKRFKKDGNVVQLIPQSYNPEHQIQIYDLKDTQIEIIGKVVECKIEF